MTNRNSLPDSEIIETLSTIFKREKIGRCARKKIDYSRNIADPFMEKLFEIFPHPYHV